MKENIIKIQTMVQIAILASLASSIGIIDKLVSANLFPMVPGIKIGIANVIILYGIIKYEFKYSFLVTLLKIIIVNLMFGGISSFIIGGTSTILSYITMRSIYIKLKEKVNVVTISIVGGFVHINCQLIIISILYNIGKEIYVYGFLLIITSFITSIIVGMLVKKVMNIHFEKKHIN